MLRGVIQESLILLWLERAFWISLKLVSYTWSLAFTYTEIECGSLRFVCLLKCVVVVRNHLLLNGSPLFFIYNCLRSILLRWRVLWNLMALDKAYDVLLVWTSSWMHLVGLRVHLFKLLLLELPLIVFLCHIIFGVNLRLKCALLVKQ